MTQKIGRNAPCPCGSGTKFRKCHGRDGAPAFRVDNLESAPPDVAYLATAMRRAGLQPGRLVPSIVHQGYRIRAVRDTIYWARANQTFAEFLFDTVKRAVGKPWYMGQVGLPEDHRHQILRWFASQAERSRRVVGDERFRDGDVWGAPPTGDDLSLLALGYDLLYLEHYGALPRKLVERLTTKREFQGALHEIAVAATFVRAAFEVTFLDERDQKHGEFTAIDPASRTEIVVEAKSRHRAGVLHERGPINEARALRGDVEGLVNEALEQADPKRPFMLFIDVNVPPVPGIPLQERVWFRDLWEAMQALRTPTCKEPDSFNAMFFMSYPFHWEGTNPATLSAPLSIISSVPRHPVSADVVARIARAMDDYGKIPEEV